MTKIKVKQTISVTPPKHGDEKETNILNEVAERSGQAVADYFDRFIIESLTAAPYGYKYVYVPVYKFYRTIKYKDYCWCEECGNEHFNWRTKEVGVKKIGQKRIKVPKTFADIPLKKRGKPQIIKFKRYSPLKAN